MEVNKAMEIWSRCYFLSVNFSLDFPFTLNELMGFSNVSIELITSHSTENKAVYLYFIIYHFIMLEISLNRVIMNSNKYPENCAFWATKLSALH